MAETSNTDRLRRRRPTSHERESGRPWDESYSDGPAPWDIGRPQPAIAELIVEGVFAGDVLDAGCGTGEHALAIASAGGHVLGVDVAETALAMARAKAVERDLDVEFAAADALELHDLDRAFDTVLDCGLFHTFDAQERPRYVGSLASVTKQGGRLHVLCFSDEGENLGPHPVSRNALEAAFSADRGWRVVTIEASEIQTRFRAEGLPAWRAAIVRL